MDAVVKDADRAQDTAAKELKAALAKSAAGQSQKK